jgi:hypothetical protein
MANFSITDFKARMAHDGARPNLFHITLNKSHNDGSYFSAKPDDLYICRASSIPGATLGTVVVPYLGREVKFAGNRTFADWTVTVINDENFVLRERLENWMNKINTHQDNNRSGKLNEYYSTATVSQLSKGASKADGKATRKYTIHNMFPVDLSEITLDWGDNDSIEEFTCTFAYDYWTADLGSATNKSTLAIT